MKTSKNNSQKRKLRLASLLLRIAGPVNTLLPFLTKLMANRQLSHLKEYSGHAYSSKLSFTGNKLIIKKIYLDKKEKGNSTKTRFLAAEKITVNIDHASLWKGFVAADVNVESPTVSIVKNATPPPTAPSKPMEAQPFLLRKLEIINGQVEYLDSSVKYPIELKADKIYLLGENFSNVPHPASQLPTEISLKGDVCSGLINARIKADLAQPQPTFDVNAEVRGMELKQMNSFFKTYGKFDVNQGTLNLFMEAAAKENSFEGYVKPQITNLDVVGPEDKNKSLASKVWQGAVGAAAAVLKNQSKDQLATKIPFKGKLKTTQVNVWYAVGEVLTNAFIQALKSSIDYEININSVDDENKK
ncbi:MAG: DUF748 domain-containing protein [Bacteroidota bacterium]